MYLTFDDGPTPELTNWILDFLERENVKATFFCVGNNVKKYPDLFKAIQAKGHVVGNHTMHHEKATETGRKEYLSSIEEAAMVIDSNLFRPPYGRLPWGYARTIHKNYSIVMWSWLSYDYDHSISPDQIISKANRIRPGDILVMHDNQKMIGRIQEILPKIIQIVRSKGLKFDVISF